MSNKPRLVVLSGSGISAESGIPTFRDAKGLWEGHRWEEVASPDGFERDPALVLHFYNVRRAALKVVEPNAGHFALVKLEEKFDVHIITQNVDDLHERAGSKNVLHLHGELRKVRSTVNRKLVLDWDGDLNPGNTGPDGAQLRPHIVWFGEEVPLMPQAEKICSKADLMIVVGTSLVVYPANGLVYEAPDDVPLYVVDPHRPSIDGYRGNVEFIEQTAAIGLPRLAARLMAQFG